MTAHSRKRYRKLLRRARLYFRLMLGTETVYHSQSKNSNKKASNSEKERESDFQKCNIIRFKCPVFNKKIIGHSVEQESIAHSKEISDRNCH